MEKNKCCGCSACEQICPKKCIKMVEDEKGFIYPKINKQNCINCGRCISVCPMINNEKLKQAEKFEIYKLTSRQTEIIKTSSSGGAFVEIVKNILSNVKPKKYKIYGAIMNDNLKVKHIGITDIKQINKLQKSKYVQSNMQKIYSDIKKELEDDTLIIFSGTPCQVAGLKNFINNQNEKNLYTIDILCHGVPSQKVFNMYVNSLENKYHSKVKKITFRNKKKIGNKIDSYCVKIELENSKCIEEYSFKNWYMLGFLKDLFYRESCTNCPFAKTTRVSDITIGDFWGIDEIDKKLDANAGISLCFANNEKGKEIFKSLKIAEKIDEKNMQKIIKNNRNLSKPSEMSQNSKSFFEELNKSNDFIKTIRKYIRRKI